MCDKFWEIILTILGGFASGLVGVWLFYHQRKIAPRDAFRVFISLKKSEIPQHGSGCMDFYTGSKTELRDAIFRTVPFLCKEQVSRLKGLWAEYNDPKTHIKLEKGHEGGSDSLAAEIGKSTGEEKVVDRRKFLHDFLDRFSNAVDCK
jgi:hypothetical protein